MAELRERQPRPQRPPRRGAHPRPPEGEPERTWAEEPREEQPEEAHGQATEEQREQAAEEPEQEQGAEEQEQDDGKRQSRFARIGMPVIGWGLVLLVLAGYFVWLASQMGTAAVTGIGPLVAVFAAAGVGVLLAGAALLLGRRGRKG